MKSIVWTMKIRIPVAVFVGFGIMCIIATPLVSISSLASPSSSSSLTIDGVQCDKQEYSDIHIHMHLDIFINGEEFLFLLILGLFLITVYTGCILTMIPELYI